MTPLLIQHVLMSGSFGGVVELGRILPGARVSVLTLLDGNDRPWILNAVTDISYIVNGSSCVIITFVRSPCT